MIKHIAWNAERRQWIAATPEQIAQGHAIALYWVEAMQQWVTVPGK